MVEVWLRTPEVVRWWGEPAEQFALISEDFDEPLMRQWIVEHGERPFAYVQAYSADTWPQPHFARLSHGSVAIDTFIGDPTMIGHGHGRMFLRAFAQMLIDEGASSVGVDPAVDNHRARRAYAHAGFAEAGVFETSEGPVVLMLYR